jgi:dipeptidyl-peptidase 4
MHGMRSKHLLFLALLPFRMFALPPSDSLTVAWIQGGGASEALATGSFQWLANNTLLFYSSQLPPADRRLDVVNPRTGSSTTLIRGTEALAAMRNVVGEARTPSTFGFPDHVDNAGRRALYELDNDLYLLDLKKTEFRPITATPENEQCAAFSPDGRYVSFVRSNDLFLYDIDTGTETRITSDGSDSLLNGTLSWVYWEEVYGRRDQGYWWSPDSRSIAFYRTDESGVSVQHYVDFSPWDPAVHRQRYPKLGGKNPAVNVGIYDIATKRTVWMDQGPRPAEYLVRLQWLPDNRRLAVRTLNRLQTRMDLFLVDASSGSSRHLLTETDSGWVNVSDDLVFLADGRHFLWSSERDGYKHLYRYTLDGRLVNRVTSGNWALRASGGLAWVDQALAGVDEQEGLVYFTALEKSSIERHLYRAKTDGTGFARITKEEGVHVVDFSPDGRYYVDRWSNASTLPSLSLHRADGSRVTPLASARPEAFSRFNLQYPAFFSIITRDGFAIPAQVLTPAGFDPARKYPVILYVYGGPSAPQVVNEWQRYTLWENLLAQHGFVVMHIDPRSATAISKSLENLVSNRLMTTVELNDLVDAARWVKHQPWADSSRLGLWGWSGGGTYTMLALTKSTEFKAGIAVAGVTDFRFYDTKWGESVMRTEAENRKGLEDFSLLRSAKDLHGRLMIVHGTYDDNVQIQNAWAFIDELIKANKQFDLMIYPMRQHGIADRPARIHLFSTMLEFWLRNL